VIDLGGSVAMRPVWEKHYTSASAIIFVVDVSGQSTIEQLMEARAFYRFMTDDDSSMPPILIFFNKVDLRLTDDVKATDQGDSHVAQSSLNHDLPLTNFSLLQIASIFLKPVAVTPAASWSCIQTLGLINQSQENNPCCVELLIQRTGEQNETNSFQNENFFFRNRLQASDSFYTKVALTAGSSKTGENVRLAFEWLLYRVQSIHNNT
jgi:GTPase SAR1 family protein